MAVMSGFGTSPVASLYGGGPSADPYAQQLQQITQATQQAGITGPVRFQIGGGPTPGPQEEAAAKTAYGGLTQLQPAEAPLQQISGFYGMASPYMTDIGQQRINQALAQSGFGPGPSGQAGGGAGALGPYAELAGRLQAQLAAQAAQPLTSAVMAQYTQGGRLQDIYAQALGREAEQRYGALTRVPTTTVQGQLGGATSGGVQARTFPTLDSPWMTQQQQQPGQQQPGTSFGAAPGSAQPGPAPGAGGGSVGGVGWNTPDLSWVGEAGGTPWPGGYSGSLASGYSNIGQQPTSPWSDVGAGDPWQQLRGTRRMPTPGTPEYDASQPDYWNPAYRPTYSSPTTPQPQETWSY